MRRSGRWAGRRRVLREGRGLGRRAGLRVPRGLAPPHRPAPPARLGCPVRPRPSRPIPPRLLRESLGCRVSAISPRLLSQSSGLGTLRCAAMAQHFSLAACDVVGFDLDHTLCRYNLPESARVSGAGDTRRTASRALGGSVVLGPRRDRRGNLGQKIARDGAWEPAFRALERLGRGFWVSFADPKPRYFFTTPLGTS